MKDKKQEDTPITILFKTTGLIIRILFYIITFIIMLWIAGTYIQEHGGTTQNTTNLLMIWGYLGITVIIMKFGKEILQRK